MKETQNKSNSIEKALAILGCFVPENREIGTIEIAVKLGLHKATASRILRTLVRKQFLRQDPKTRKFSLGPSALRIGRALEESLENELVVIAKPHIDQLRTRLNETVGLEQLVGNSTMLVYIAEGHQRHRIVGGPGESFPINATAGGRAIVAFSDPDRIKMLVNGNSGFDAFTPNTITSADELLRQFREIRLKGFAVDREEIGIGINGIGAPIFNHENSPIASVVVIGPSHRVTPDEDSEMVHLVKQTARTISALLMQPE